MVTDKVGANTIDSMQDIKARAYAQLKLKITPSLRSVVKLALNSFHSWFGQGMNMKTYMFGYAG